MKFSSNNGIFGDGPNLNKISMRGRLKTHKDLPEGKLKDYLHKHNLLRDDEPDIMYTPLQDNGIVREGVRVEAIFRNIEDRLLQFIADADIVVGCVAWLTSKPILQALQSKVAVSLIVQKEDFLRPDIGVSSNWKMELRTLYDALPGGLEPFLVGGMGDGIMSAVGNVDSIEAVRCVGYVNTAQYAAFPRMHNKFIVACGLSAGCPEPYAVWTGSYNFTANASRSLENAVIIEDFKERYLPWAYYEEYSQIAILSESLDWEKKWAVPEWQLGPYDIDDSELPF